MLRTSIPESVAPSDADANRCIGCGKVGGPVRVTMTKGVLLLTVVHEKCFQLLGRAGFRRAVEVELRAAEVADGGAR